MIKYNEVARFIGELESKHKISPKVQIENAGDFFEQVILIDYDFIKFRFNFAHRQLRCSLEWEERNEIVAILSNGKEIEIYDYSALKTAFEVAIEVAFELKSNTMSNKPMYLQILDVLKEFGDVAVNRNSLELIQDVLYFKGFIDKGKIHNFFVNISDDNTFEVRLNDEFKVTSLEELRIKADELMLVVKREIVGNLE